MRINIDCHINLPEDMVKFYKEKFGVTQTGNMLTLDSSFFGVVETVFTAYAISEMADRKILEEELRFNQRLMSMAQLFAAFPGYTASMQSAGISPNMNHGSVAIPGMSYNPGAMPTGTTAINSAKEPAIQVVRAQETQLPTLSSLTDDRKAKLVALGKS